MKKLILIDGSSILSTGFYGNAPIQYLAAKTEEDRQKGAEKLLQTTDGIYTNAIFTMTKSILSLIKNQKPTHIAVSWDVSRDTFRRKIYKDYKGTRAETPKELKQQFGTMQELLDAMGIAQFAFKEYEADDIIGTLATKFGENIPTCILTKDCDALQLVDENTRLWLITEKAGKMYKEVICDMDTEFTEQLPNNVFEFTPDYVRYFYGLAPNQITDKKALEGDKSDNIPGVAGIGEKGAVALLQEYTTIENLYESIVCEKDFMDHLKDIGIKRIPVKKLINGKESAFMSKQLAKINCFIKELENVKLEDFNININTQRTLEYFKKLEFKSIKIA
ncbi:MAG: hypothetical protein APF76_09890 [Desulfitibacter sp. BRH_c19]|nr:MAG: hypothetical protein APF76_09890 [Desulfitibacter sp. BRH_c19]